ncbi:MAG: hypothetical protein EZS28_034238 [Streblomastix strix]|uniref:Uncharacterized protein n=1 Tax=Streblomastix strix TaxID=222440 RepID=A0A5J4UKG8_9EUKA|nr:MAG: hypothetical protein EZS28_034238 [Streblomastix strix]
MPQKAPEIYASSYLLKNTPFLRKMLSILDEDISWTLTNLFSGNVDEIKSIVKLGVVPPLVKLLTSHNCKVRKQSAWAIANIAHEDDPYLIAQLSQAGIEDQLLKLLCIQNSISQTGEDDEDFDIDQFKDEFSIQTYMLTRVLTNMDLNQKTQIASAEFLITYIMYYYQQADDVELLGFALDKLNFLIGNDQILKQVDFRDSVKCIAKLINFNDYRISKYSLCILESLAGGSDKHTQLVIDSGALADIQSLLQQIPNQNYSITLKSTSQGVNAKFKAHEDMDEILGRVCFVLSNITAGTPAQTQQCFDSGLVQMIIEILTETRLEEDEIRFIEKEKIKLAKLNRRKRDQRWNQFCFDWVKDAFYVIANCTSDSSNNSVKVEILKFSK